MTDLFFEMNAADIEARMAAEGRVPLAPLVKPHELSEGGVVMKDENLTVTAALVDHPPLVPAFAYRFDAPDRSLVISGDTRRSENLVELARRADVLVHSALYLPALDRLIARVGAAPRLRESILALQAPVEDAARVAQDAGVKMLVLSHLIPADDPEVTEAMWLESARAHFRGSIVVTPSFTLWSPLPRSVIMPSSIALRRSSRADAPTRISSRISSVISITSYNPTRPL